MKLSDLNAQADGLKSQRDAKHEELHAHLATLPDGFVERERAIRAEIRTLNEAIFPLEQERAEIDRMVKGQTRKQAESFLGEPVTLD